MASVLHGCARTTPRVRAELQASKDSTSALDARYGLNPKTVAKWRKRDTVEDAQTGPKVRRSTVLSEAEESAVAELRRRAMLPLDDLLGRLRESIPKLSRSALQTKASPTYRDRTPRTNWRKPPTGTCVTRDAGSPPFRSARPEEAA